MKYKQALSLIVLFSCLLLPPASPNASGGDRYASFWKCSDGNTYGLIANGSNRSFYLPTGASPIFFSGVKSGEFYSGTIYAGGQQIPVSGPISRNSTRVTLNSNDGRSWVLNFSHK